MQEIVMPRKFAIDYLPSDVRDQLDSRIVDNPDLTVDKHTTWLAEQGFTVSRSSVGRYMLARKETITKQQAEKINDRLLERDDRIRCLEVASEHFIGDPARDLIPLAQKLFNWAETGVTPVSPEAKVFQIQSQ